MSPFNPPSAGSIRSKYAYLFSSIAELDFLLSGKKPGTKFEEIEAVVASLYDSSQIDEYLHSNLLRLFELYPSLLPGVVSEALKTDFEAENKRLRQLDATLDIIIGDICGLIHDLTTEMREHDRETLIQSLTGIRPNKFTGE